MFKKTKFIGSLIHKTSSILLNKNYYSFTIQSKMEPKDYFESWKQPQKKPDSYITGLHVTNSLFPSKLVEVIPTQGRRLNWYMCGPTVYDSAHLGHARTYMSFDMIKRVLRDYFGYDIMLCMNITDIDDKIIMRSKETGEEFTTFARKWENDFFDDMKALNVEIPDIITRVSEFVPDIIKFIEKIISNGYAYESNGSVYFDVTSYKEKNNHVYGKLAPKSVNNEKLLQEGEGALTEDTQEKKKKSDFVLWKKSKPGEPKWPSPWGEGRPGWHIECSVMANHAFNGNLDIHSGGEDLKFPHHENEIAQSEAFYDNDQWINYFLHSGHLNIEGLKMSKSLKNFIKIKNLLQTFNARQIRLLFLLHNYEAIMDYNANSISEATNKDRKYIEFFLNIKVATRENPITDNQYWVEKDFTLNKLFRDKKNAIHKHFQNNFDTPNVIHEIDEIISATNSYLATPPAKYPLLNSIRDYIVFIFNCMGLTYEKASGANQPSASNLNKEEILDPLMKVLADFRTKVKDAARVKNVEEVLKACDEVRDDILPYLGVRLEDKGKEGSLWKYEDKEVLLKEKANAEAEKKKKLEEKLKKEEEKAKKQAELELKSKIPPNELFKSQTNLYSKFDENGIPTHDAEGKEISKGLAKKLKKEYEAQAVLYNSYKEKNA